MYYPVHRKELYFSSYPVLKQAGCIGDLNIANDSDVRELIRKKFSFTEEQIEVVLNAATPFESFEKLYDISSEKYDVFEDEVDICLPQELIMEDFVETEIIINMLKEQLVEVLATLSEREQKVLKLRYGLIDGEEKTLEDVGKECFITRERVRQIESKALQKLRYPSRSRKLKDYVDF